MAVGMISFFTEILSTVFENEVLDAAGQAVENGKKKRLEQKTIENLEEKLKEQLEQDSVKEWLALQEYQMEQKGHLFSPEDRQELIDGFFAGHPELRYVHSQNTEMVIAGCVDAINKWADGILSSDSKLTMVSLKNAGESNKREIVEHLNAGIREILDAVRETKNGADKEGMAAAGKRCTGYGWRKGKCENPVLAKDAVYCKDCMAAEYADKIENLYRIQHYSIKSKNGYFIAEQNSGIIRANALVFPVYTETDELTLEDIVKIPEIIISEGADTWQYIHLVANGELGEKCEKYLWVYRERLKVFHEQDIIREIMDFTGYLKSHIRQYNDSSLSDHYIDILDKNTGEPLEYSVRDFLQETEYNAFLILGDYGCGKTSFLLNLACQLSEEYFCWENEYIPIFIPLRDYAKAIHMENLFLDIFVNKCHMPNVSIEAFKLMLKYMKFVLLFDGFDEVAKRVNYDVKFEIFQQICQYCSENTKIIVTCRPNYFQESGEYRKLMQNAYLQFEPNMVNNALFTETYIADLEPEQVHEYILSYSDVLGKEGLDAEEIEDIIGNTHDLTDLSRRPFLLNIIVQTLPKIISDLDDKEKKGKINAAFLYQNYTDVWLDRENSKGKTLIRKEDKLHFCMHMAYKMYQDDILAIHFSKLPDEIRTYFPNLHQMDEIDYFSHDIQSCSFMNSDGNGNFKFIHKSFMEYFVAYYIVEMLRRGKKNPEKVEAVLADGDISTEVALFIVDLLCDEEETYRDIRKEVENLAGSRIERVRQNAVTLLSKMHYNMAFDIVNGSSYVNSDFGHALIENAVITGVDFAGVVFYEAVIRDVQFTNCNFRGANFQKAYLKGVDFSGQSLEYADFAYGKIVECNFSNCYMADVRLLRAFLRENDFERCDMSGVEAEGTEYSDNRNFQTALGIPYDMR